MLLLGGSRPLPPRKVARPMFLRARAGASGAVLYRPTAGGAILTGLRPLQQAHRAGVCIGKARAAAPEAARAAKLLAHRFAHTQPPPGSIAFLMFKPFSDVFI